MARPGNNREAAAASAEEFRWQGFFQRGTEALFVLNRRRRLVFVNRAWENLTGLAGRDVRGLTCRRRPRDAAASWTEIVQTALAPPPEVLAGKPGQSRRLLPVTENRPGPQWWHITFFPLAGQEGLEGILGKITPIPAEGVFAGPPLPEKIIALRDRLNQGFRLELLDSAVPSLARVAEQIRLAAQTRLPVLVTGEPGTGKHWAARTIHQHSPQKEQPFVALDCGRVPLAVLEGLFSPAGPFPLPPAGTVYLREVARLPRELQDGLARWLASRAESGPRVLAGLARDPGAEVKAGRLLPQLHCLISPLTIWLPPLRERLAQLDRLLETLLERASAAADRKVSGLSPDALTIMRTYPWPGNLRELYQVLVGACAHAKGERLEVGDLPFYIRTSATPAPRVLPLDSLLEQVERRLITLALRQAQNNKSKAAELLAIWRPRLLRRMEALGIQSEYTSPGQD